jgi:hypothetical protein
MIAVGDISSPKIAAGTSATLSAWGNLGAAAGNTKITAETTVAVGVHGNAAAEIAAGTDVTADVTGNLTGKMATDTGDVSVGVLGNIVTLSITANLGWVDVVGGGDASDLNITADHTVLSIAERQ